MSEGVWEQRAREVLEDYPCTDPLGDAAHVILKPHHKRWAKVDGKLMMRCCGELWLPKDYSHHRLIVSHSQ
jgi:hypothetical protein